MAPVRKKQKLSNGEGAVENVQEVVEDKPLTDKPPGDKPDDKPEKNRRSLFIRSLPATTTSESLTTLFSDSYPIKHATAVIDPATKQCRGYGFVTLADAEDAQKARQEFNGHVFEGRKLRVEIAEPRQRDGEGPTAEIKAKVKPERELVQPSKLIVRNLPWSIKGSKQLEKLFQSYGKVKQAYVPTKGPGLMAGFGFVVMRGRRNAEKAIEGVNGKEVDGRTLAVDWAVEKKLFAGAAVQEADEGDGTEHVDADDEDDANSGGEEDGFGDDENDEDENSDEIDEDGYSDEDVDIEIDDSESRMNRPDEQSTTVFVRNLPFTCTDEDLEDHFSRFGKTRYARIVVDSMTERSKGTGFVCFYNKEDADGCLRGVPKRPTTSAVEKSKVSKSTQVGQSILQNEDTDLSGQYTLDGRVLQVSRAVNKSEANRLTEEGAAHRSKQSVDKRRLYLLSEGTISSKAKLYDQLSPSEKTMREASARQRKALIESNPSLHLSLTRLSIRNIPRTIDSKELKALARAAVVGFAIDVKGGLRQPLSKEELSRGGAEMVLAEQARKKAGKGLVRQAKVVFEGASGGKVSEDSGAGRSRGYGFVEFYTHRSALMGLRWLNGHAIGYQVKDNSKGKISREEMQDRKKRLIVEFAIENAQVVLRRKEREVKARERSALFKPGKPGRRDAERASRDAWAKRGGKAGKPTSLKRKRGDADVGGAANTHNDEAAAKKPIDEKLARRNQIIGRKRAMRKNRAGGK